jgi:hypothetical protein
MSSIADQLPQPFAGGGERACARLAVRRALTCPEVSACKGRSEAERQKFLERSGRRPRSFGDPCGWRGAGPR